MMNMHARTTHKTQGSHAVETEKAPNTENTEETDITHQAHACKEQRTHHQTCMHKKLTADTHITHQTQRTLHANTRIKEDTCREFTKLKDHMQWIQRTHQTQGTVDTNNLSNKCKDHCGYRELTKHKEHS